MASENMSKSSCNVLGRAGSWCQCPGGRRGWMSKAKARSLRMRRRLSVCILERPHRPSSAFLPKRAPPRRRCVFVCALVSDKPVERGFCMCMCKQRRGKWVHLCVASWAHGWYGGTMGHFALPKKNCSGTCRTTGTCTTTLDTFPLWTGAVGLVKGA